MGGCPQGRPLTAPGSVQPVVVEAGAALFDMDGTLVDSTAVVEEVWSDFARAHGVDPVELLAFSHGRQAIDTARRFAPPDADHAALVRALQRRELDRLAGTVEIPGARALLDSLGGAPVAVVTSAPRSLAVGRLEAAGLPVPPVLVTADDIERGKPDPSGYVAAAHALGVPIARAVVFEDAEAGLRAGLAASARAVVVVGAANTSGLPTGPGVPPLVRASDLTAVTATWSESDRTMRLAFAAQQGGSSSGSS